VARFGALDARTKRRLAEALLFRRTLAARRAF
jgi:hypothetical protein